MSTSVRSHDMNTGHLVIRPSSGSYTRWVGLRKLGVVLAVSAAYLFIRYGLVGGAVFFGIVVAFTASVLGVTFLWIHRARVVVTPTEIGKAGLLGRPKMRPRADIETLVLATTLDKLDTPNRAYNNLFVLNRDGRQIMRLRSTFWIPEDIERVVERLGIAPVEVEGVRSVREVFKMYPNASRGLERYPFRYVALIVVGFFAAIIVIVFVVEGVKAVIRAVG